jgi:ribosomal protein S18 acetylase RimI-like enzyme
MNGKSTLSTPAARRSTRRAATPSPPLNGDSALRPLATIRAARRGDLDAVIELDAQATGIEKRDYWRSLFRRYGEPAASERHFLVALDGATVVGYIIGEVRDWEFGSAPCGWVFALNVRPDTRLAGTGTRLLQASCALFRKAGVRTVRTILARDNTLILSFFRSQGMTTGPFIPLEMSLDV